MHYIRYAQWRALLRNYDAVIVNISGGKDSQSILDVVCSLAPPGRVYAVHSDTGLEWNESAPHCDYLCRHYDVPFAIVHPLRPLPMHILKRGSWPSLSCRYCTSDTKRDPIAKWVRAEFPNGRILMVTGERREESPRRARLPEFERHHRLTLDSGKRVVDHWRPVLDWKEPEVWANIHATGLDYHRAYKMGNSRVSCVACVLASNEDIQNGHRTHPQTIGFLLWIEKKVGHSFKNGKTLDNILTGYAGAEA